MVRMRLSEEVDPLVISCCFKDFRLAGRVPRGIALSVWIALGIGLFARGSAAQDQLRRFGEPLLVVNTGGHSAPVRALAFTPDGTQLLSAGQDKVVHVWEVGGGRPRLARTLRPLIWRAARGTLYAMALAPPDAQGQQLLAVAGFGITDDRGHITLYRYPGTNDVPTGDVLGQLMNRDPNAFDPRQRQGHSDVVSDLAFRPGHTELASASRDGDVRIWDPAQRTTLIRLAHGRAVLRLAFTPDGRRLVTATEDGLIRLWDVDRRALLATYPPPGGDPDGRAVNALAVSPGGEWVVFGRENGSLVRLNAANLGNAVSLPTNQQEQGAVEALAISRDGRRLVTCIVSHGRRLTPSSRPIVECDVELRGMPNGEVLSPLFSAGRGALNPPLSNLSYACAFSPDDHYLAVSGGDSQSIFFVDLRSPRYPFVELRGEGESVWDVAFGADSRNIAFRHRPVGAANAAVEQRGFDLATRELSESVPGPLTRVSTTLQGWSMRPVSPYQIEILDPRGVRRRLLSLDRVGERRWWSYGFIPGVQGIHPRSLAAVGCEVGVILFDVETGDRIRYLIGHSDKVYALSPSPDGRWLVTGGSDQTVRLWSLLGRDRKPPLGAAFRADAAGSWSVVSVEARGFADGIGLKTGDAIAAFRLDNVPQGLDKLSTLPDQAAAGHGLYFEVQRAGQLVRLPPTTKRDSPALTLFSGRNREWVLWMPDGYYETSIAGDRRHLGWHLNHEQDVFRLDRPTDFFPIDRYEARFHQPAVLARLVETADLNEALRAVPPAAPAPPPPAVVEPPVVRLLSPPLDRNRVLAPENWDRPLRVRAENRPPGLIRQVRVMVDGRPDQILPPPQRPEAAMTLEFKLSPPPGRHLVEIVAENDRGAEGRTSFEAVAVAMAPPPRPPRLVVLAFGAEKFGRILPDVERAGQDARDLGEFLLAPGNRRRFPTAESTVLDEIHTATSTGLIDALGRLETWAYQDKTLGAGDAVFVAIESHFLDYDGRGFLAGTDLGEESPPVPALEADALSETLGRLATAGCRVVLLIDGLQRPESRARTRSFRNWVRDLHRNRNVTVFVASKTGPSWAQARHRVFAQALLDSFDVKARSRIWIGPEGPVSFRDFSATVLDRVRELQPLQFADAYPPSGLSADVRLFEPPASAK